MTYKGQPPLNWKHGGYDAAERRALESERCAVCGGVADGTEMIYAPLTQRWRHIRCGLKPTET